MNTNRSNRPAAMKPHAEPASTGSTEAGKNFGRMALIRRLSTCAGESPTNSFVDGPVTVVESDDTCFSPIEALSAAHISQSAYNITP